VTYAAFDLEQFGRAPRLEPTAADISLGQQIIGVLHTPGHPSYADEFIPYRKAETDWPSQRFPFGVYPTWWWKSRKRNQRELNPPVPSATQLNPRRLDLAGYLPDGL
jgi:hypothetical protein